MPISTTHHTNMSICPKCHVKLLKMAACCGKKVTGRVHRCPKCSQKYILRDKRG